MEAALSARAGVGACSWRSGEEPSCPAVSFDQSVPDAERDG